MSSGAEALYNRGCWVMRPARDVEEKTLVVLGAARGGTSMIAGALHRLGVPMAERTGVVYEDVPLSEAVEKGDLEALERLIAERNARHPVWGWKRPSSLRFRERWIGRFRNPHYVAVFRDLFAIANRNRLSMQSEVLQNMRHSQEHFGLLLDFLQADAAPVLLVSYEKAMAHPEHFVGALREFVGTGDAAQVQAALRSIEADSATYLKTSRIAGALGVLDKIQADRVAGWALFRDAPHKPVQVKITVNGEREYTVTANRLRPDLKTKGLHPTGERGFALRLAGAERLRPGDEVAARVVGDIVDLRNSPRVFAG